MLRHINMGFLGAKLLMKIRQNKDQRNQQCLPFHHLLFKKSNALPENFVLFPCFPLCFSIYNYLVIAAEKWIPHFSPQVSLLKSLFTRFYCFIDLKDTQLQIWKSGYLASLRGFIALLTLKVQNCRFENLLISSSSH